MGLRARLGRLPMVCMLLAWLEVCEMVRGCLWSVCWIHLTSCLFLHKESWGMGQWRYIWCSGYRERARDLSEVRACFEWWNAYVTAACDAGRVMAIRYSRLATSLRSLAIILPIYLHITSLASRFATLSLITICMPMRPNTGVCALTILLLLQ